MFYTSAWCLTTEDDFESKVPLLLLGQSITNFNSQYRLSVLFLEGFNKLSSNYKKQLFVRNIDVIDYSTQFSNIVSQYKKISEYYSHYERNCLLRWVAFHEYLKKNKCNQFYHIDSDIILHTSLERLANEAAGLTFMTLGCPVFLTISDFNWFDIYIRELSVLNYDASKYLINNNITIEMCRENDRKKFNISLFRDPIGSDQDLLEYLISSNILIQSDYNLITNREFYYVQNPLHFSQMSSYLKIAPGEIVTCDEHGSLSYAGKLIPFTHFQGSFCFRTAKIYLLVRQFSFLNNYLPKILLPFRISSAGYSVPLISKLLLMLFKNRYRTRSEIIQALMSRDSLGQIELVKLLNIINKYHP